MLADQVQVGARSSAARRSRSRLVELLLLHLLQHADDLRAHETDMRLAARLQLSARAAEHSALRARRADVLAAVAAAEPAARAAGRLSRACQQAAKSVTFSRIGSVHFAQQPSISRSARKWPGRRKWPGSIAGMQAAGSEAERRQAGLTAAEVSVALLT